jgi:hypothetical protein
LPDERLRHYVSILEEQCAELQQALDDMQMPIRLQLDLSPFAKFSLNSVIAYPCPETAAAVTRASRDEAIDCATAPR